KGNIESLEKKSPALGIIPNCEFLEQEVTLNSGDTLFIYSDGLTEARNENGDFFGEERLKNILLHNSSLSSQNLGELVLSFVDQFKGTAKIHDDMTMVIAKVN
ncbi:MAG: PP2C family protein-serine/threonine phosphatase, partial [Promethearchaeota archaeon]